MQAWLLAAMAWTAGVALQLSSDAAVSAPWSVAGMGLAGVMGLVAALREMVGMIDSAKTTTNLWGERWSKLCQNGMKNGVSAATGMTGTDCDRNDAVRRFSIKLGGEALRAMLTHGGTLADLKGQLGTAADWTL